MRHGAQRRFRYIDDGREDHHRQHEDRREQTRARAEGKGFLNGGDEHDHADEAVDHRGDAREQLYRRADDRRKPWRSDAGEEHGGQKSHRHADEDSARRAVDARKNEGEDAVLCARGGVGRVPDLAEEEFSESDLADGGNARENQVDADEQHERYGDHAAEQENEVDEVFQRLAHAAVTRLGGGGLCALCRRRDVCSRHGAYFATGTAPAALMRSFAAVEVA